MKRTLVFILILNSFASVSQSTKPKTLITTDPEQISGFGALLFSFTPIDGQLATLTGGGGAAIFDNTFFIGGYGLGMSGDREVTVEGIDYRVDYGHGGIWLGYIMKPVELFHLGVESKFGWGRVRYRSVNGVDPQPADDQVFVFYPQLTGEVNLAYWFKLNAGVGYQKTVGIDNFAFTNTDFDGPAFSVSLIFGWFN